MTYKLHDAHSNHRNYYQLHVSDMSFCFERCRLIKNYQAFQELCPFYCVFYLPKMWWIHLDLGFLKCLLFIVTRLEKPHKCVYKCPTDNTAKVLVLLFNN